MRSDSRPHNQTDNDCAIKYEDSSMPTYTPTSTSAMPQCCDWGDSVRRECGGEPAATHARKLEARPRRPGGETDIL